MNNDEEVKREIDAHIVERELMERGFLQSCWGCLVVRPLLRPLNFFLPVEVLMERIEKITDQVKEAQKKKYPVSKVFVTFETEEGQRTALSALTCSKLDVHLQRKNAIDPNALFQGEKVLKVSKPTEPNSVRWLDLQVT